MITLLLTTWIALTPRDPSLPTIPPEQPTSIVLPDGTRTICTPDYSTCDWGHNYG